MIIQTLRPCHFESSEDFTPIFESGALNVIKSNVEELASGSSPSLITAFWNMGILFYKQATCDKTFDNECRT